MAAEKLTALQVKRAKPGMHGDGKGLWLWVSATGAKSWCFRYMIDGRAREMGLGSAYDVSLAEAREEARKCRVLIKSGGDPIDARRAQKAAARLERAKAMSFRQCAEAYIAAHRDGWRNARHAQQWPKTLADFVHPIFGDLPVQSIDVALVMKALEPLWATRPETASRVRGRVESVLNWAAAHGYRQGENPARWRGHLENLLPKKSKVRQVKHHAALPHVEVAALLTELRDQEGGPSRALEFLILTASRTNETRGARWDEIDFAERMWLIPGSRMKSGREHRCPLSDPAIDVLKQMEAIRTGEFVFPGPGGRSPIGATAMILALGRLRPGLTVHGFRSCFSDWCAERTNFPAEVREMALAHTVSDKVEAAYRRGDLLQRRRQLMEAWARFCSAPVSDAVVVPLAGGAGRG